jgi:hypothetical protein
MGGRRQLRRAPGLVDAEVADDVRDPRAPWIGLEVPETPLSVTAVLVGMPAALTVVLPAMVLAILARRDA